MANNFVREPTEGGDSDNWHAYAIQQMRRSEGVLTSYLYNNSGALSCALGLIGINDGTNRGTCVVDTVTDIDFSGCTVGSWAKIELTITGPLSFSLAATTIAGATTESIIPDDIKNAYNAIKGGYYVSATKRLIGIAFIRTGPVLGRIVNCESEKKGFKNIKMIKSFTTAGVESEVYVDTIHITFTGWNMDANNNFDVTLPYSLTSSGYLRAKATVIDNGGGRNDLVICTTSNCTPFEGAISRSAGLIIPLFRLNGGYFDNVAHNASSGILEVDYLT